MARKTLNTTAITNELQHSAFFPASSLSALSPASPAAPAPVEEIPPAPHVLNPLQPLPSQPSTPRQAQVQMRVQEYDEESADSAQEANADASQEIPIPHEILTPASGALDAVDAVEKSPQQPQQPQHSPIPAAKGSRDDHDENSTNQQDSDDAQNQANSSARNDASGHASKLAHIENTPGFSEISNVVETIRKAVRHVGKEVSFVRLTPEEKRQLADIAYTYKSQGIKTSENEISRIGINWMLEDYQANGAQSVLALVLAALNA
jgi:hypothetical protein